MKTHLLLTAAFLTAAVFVRADVEVTMAQLRRIGFLPQDKADLRPEEKLDIKRRNPFAERKKVVATRPTEQVETEESKLRTYFDKNQVTGILKFGDKTTVTLGRLSLESGQIIPPIIPNQTHILRVLKVTDKELEIGWVEDTSAGLEPAVPRKIRKRIDLSAKVRAMIVSEDNTGDNAQSYVMDDAGKVIMPQKNVFPDPSDFVDGLPPGSDTNPLTVLTEQELKDLGSNAGIDSPAPAHRQEAAPEAQAPGNLEPPNGKEATEDSVQPDPDLADPAEKAAGSKEPAGPPAKK